MVPIRIRAVCVSPGMVQTLTEHPVWRGHIERFDYAWSGTSDGTVKVQASDPFKLLAMRQYQWEPENEQQVDQRLYEAMTGSGRGAEPPAAAHRPGLA